MTTKVAVIGAKGRMGATACEAVEGADDLELVGRFDEGDELGVSIYTPRDMPDLPSLPTIGGLESTIKLPGEQDGA